MLPVFQYFVAPLIAGIVGAFLPQLFSARFTFARFRQEQWWQAKREAYESITRMLSDILFSRSRELGRIETHGVVLLPEAQERKKELAWSLQEIASAGRYIVSEQTVTAVEKVLNTLANSGAPGAVGDYYGVLANEYDAAQAALAIVRSEAHRELGVEE
jgi:hypothetical protein